MDNLLVDAILWILLGIFIAFVTYAIGRVFGLGVGKSLLNTIKKEKK